MTTTTKKRLRVALLTVGWLLLAYAVTVASWCQLHGWPVVDRATTGALVGGAACLWIGSEL
jgi:hypothetical protein